MVNQTCEQKEGRAKIRKKYYDKNKEALNARSRDYRKVYTKTPEFKERHSKWAKEYQSRKKAEDPKYKMAAILRSRLNKLLKSKKKRGSAVTDLGCSVDFLVNYIESLFLPGMTWENHGVHGWHLDHIKPLSLFDLEDRDQLLIACHYTNLQPLWAKDNIVKSNKN